MSITFYLLFSHNLSKEQTNEIKDILGCQEIVYPPNNLQELWSSIPSNADSLTEYLHPFKNYFADKLEENDYVLVQGDFGATYIMVNYIKHLGAKPVYATTKREVIEIYSGDTVRKQSLFKHVKFRQYEE